MHLIYDSLICFNSVKSQQIDYILTSWGHDPIFKVELNSGFPLRE
ncbi:hypothetical protein MSIBF_A4570004 [groundwater metagenome]|uniref:Uncharacterized protein n=1 Tax=groundwater metagenome TaxID=717931 RepID=A0A098EDY2_9ZZZZ